MRAIPFTLKKRRIPGNYNDNRNVVVHYRGKRYELVSGQGTYDDVTAYREGVHVHVLVTNRAFGYLGLSTYDLSEEPSEFEAADASDKYAAYEPIGASFLQTEHEIAEFFPKTPWEEMRSHVIVRRLAVYCE